MECVVAVRVKDAEQDEAQRAQPGEEDAEAEEDLLAPGSVGHQASLVTEPALGGKGQVKGDGGDGGAGDEEGLELEGANVADVGEGHVALLGGEVLPVLVDDPPEEHAQEHAEPYGAGEDW